MAISQKVHDFMERASWIRKMFEEGIRLKREFGEDHVFDLSLGNPVAEPPPQLVEAMIAAARDETAGQHRYMPNAGFEATRQAIAESLSEECKVSLSSGNIIMVCGAAGGLNITLKTLLDPGDEVVLGNPYYSCYPNYITFLSGVPVYVALSADDGFRFSPETVRKKLSHKTKAILVNSPANPTGAVMTPAMLEEIAGMGHAVISDEIYHGLTYGRKAHSILEFTENAFVLGGFSKRYAMTGWRVGYAVAPKEFIRPMQKLQQNFQISPNAITQEAAIAALRFGKADAEKMKKEFHKRRDVMVKGLRSIGFEVKALPEGAFYVFVPCSSIDSDSYRLAVSILRETGVAITPGIDFGSGGEGHLRFSYAASPGRIREGIRRLGRFLGK